MPPGEGSHRDWEEAPSRCPWLGHMAAAGGERREGGWRTAHSRVDPCGFEETAMHSLACWHTLQENHFGKQSPKKLILHFWKVLGGRCSAEMKLFQSPAERCAGCSDPGRLCTSCCAFVFLCFSFFPFFASKFLMHRYT